VPIKNFKRGLDKNSAREFATLRRRFASFVLSQYLVFSYRTVARYTAAMQLDFTLNVNRCQVINVNAAIVQLFNSTFSRKPIYFDVIKGKSSSTCGPREISTSFPVSSEISDFTPCAHAQNDILRIKYAEKADD